MSTMAYLPLASAKCSSRCDEINENVAPIQMCHCSLFLLLREVSSPHPPPLPYRACALSSHEGMRTSTPHSQGNTRESARGEFREVNKWVWNVSSSHTESLHAHTHMHTRGLRKHVCDYRMVNRDSTRPCVFEEATNQGGGQQRRRK